MTPPIKMLENTEACDAFEEAGGQPLQISAPGRGVLTVVEGDLDDRDEPSYTDEELASIRRGLEAIDRGEAIDAHQMLAEIRAEHGL